MRMICTKWWRARARVYRLHCQPSTLFNRSNCSLTCKNHHVDVFLHCTDSAMYEAILICLSYYAMLHKWNVMELLNGEWGVNEIDFNIFFFLAFDSCRLTANKLTVQMECQEFNLFSLRCRTKHSSKQNIWNQLGSSSHWLEKNS